jgi:hypothetical protein
VHKNTFSVLSVAQNCADTKTEGTYEKVFGCGAHSFDMLMVLGVIADVGCCRLLPVLPESVCRKPVRRCVCGVILLPARLRYFEHILVQPFDEGRASL